MKKIELLELEGKIIKAKESYCKLVKCDEDE